MTFHSIEMQHYATVCLGPQIDRGNRTDIVSMNNMNRLWFNGRALFIGVIYGGHCHWKSVDSDDDDPVPPV